MQIKNNMQDLQDEIQDLRNYKVVKSNDLIQNTRSQLSLQEQKIVLYLISKIRPSDDDFIYQNFNMVEFCKVCGIYCDSGGNYKAVKDNIKSLADKSAWVKLEVGKETLVRWIAKARINERSGTIEIKLDDDMKPYLLQLQERFTQYELIYTLAMKSQYSIRLYELLKSYEFRKWHKFEMNELKQLLFAEKYIRFPDFKRKVLDISVREINDLSDIEITYEIIKVGRRYGKIEFSIKTKKGWKERFETKKKIEKVINPNQTLICS